MGTRHTICAVLNGEIKLAQYGQWDGKPAPQGIRILEFLESRERVQRLKDSLLRSTFVERSILRTGREYEEWYGESRSDATLVGERFWSRDLGARVLYNIIEAPEESPPLMNSLCHLWEGDWVYVINLDTEILEIYSSSPVNGRGVLAVFHGEEAYLVNSISFANFTEEKKGKFADWANTIPE